MTLAPKRSLACENGYTGSRRHGCPCRACQTELAYSYLVRGVEATGEDDEGLLSDEYGLEWVYVLSARDVLYAVLYGRRQVSYLDARGAVPQRPGDLSPEDAIAAIRGRPVPSAKDVRDARGRTPTPWYVDSAAEELWLTRSDAHLAQGEVEASKLAANICDGLRLYRLHLVSLVARRAGRTERS